MTNSVTGSRTAQPPGSRPQVFGGVTNQGQQVASLVGTHREEVGVFYSQPSRSALEEITLFIF